MAVSKNSSIVNQESEISNSQLYTQIGNQGLQKRVIQKGISWKTPFVGDEVQVHYNVGFGDGEYFDSSKNRGSPFTFKLGQCEVIKGWDEGIGTMKKGEKSSFIVPPELGYGENGSPPLIPPNSTLYFEIEMISWYTIKDISGDGGILKKIIHEGEGWATPKDNDHVLVKYEARLDDGTIVSKSSQAIEFCISNGYLCSAMSKAVKTMRKGEKAELIVKFSYGFSTCENGNNEIDCEIPPNSNLIIDIELVSWKSVINITEDNKVLKKINISGEGYDRPNEGTLARVVYIGKFENGTIFESRGSNEDPFEYICGEGKFKEDGGSIIFAEQINESLDKAIMSMKKGEQASVIVNMDSLNPKHIYEVELIDFIKEKPFWKMDTREKLEACEKIKNQGNKLFKEGKFVRASTKYAKALRCVEFDHCFNKDEKNEAKVLRLSCNLNNAACKLKLGEYNDASKLCTKVLEQDPNNIKALFRRSRAYLKTYDLEKAEADIKIALLVDPNNRDVRLELKELKQKQKQHLKCETKLFTTMVTRIG